MRQVKATLQATSLLHQVLFLSDHHVAIRTIPPGSIPDEILFQHGDWSILKAHKTTHELVILLVTASHPVSGRVNQLYSEFSGHLLLPFLVG
jgi:hypothetical protein